MTGWGVARRVPALLAAVAMLLLAACATVPTSGPIEQGPIVEPAESTQFVRVIAAPPSPGADPGEVVQGFLEAGASLEQGHAIARRYLTRAAAAQWDPDAATAVYDQQSLTVVERGDTVRVTIDLTGALARDGSLTVHEPPRARRLDFTLEQASSGPSTPPEWRITDPPAGIHISDADLRRAFRAHNVFYMSARSGHLVPDGRLVPVVGPSLPATLAQHVLSGPSAWLAPAVRSIPAGTSLALGTVLVTDGVARVELTQGALAASDEERRDLASALTWTLTELPEVTAVRLLVAGAGYLVPGAPLLMDRDDWRARSPAGGGSDPAAPYFVLTGDEVVRVAGETRAGTALPEAARGAPAALAVSPDERWAAVIGPQRRSVLRLSLAGADPPRAIEARRVTDLGFDLAGEVWFADAGRLRRTTSDGSVRPVAVPGDAEVTALALAGDGARIALVADGAVLVGSLAADAGDLAVAAQVPLDPAVADARDLAWRDATTLDILAASPEGGDVVLRVVLGSGQAQALGAPRRPSSLAAAATTGTLVASRDGVLHANVGRQWRERGPARAVAYPG